PNGDVFVAEPAVGRITLLRDSDGGGRADVRSTFAEGFQRPHGMAFQPGWLYVADVEAVWRIPYEPGQTVAAGQRQRVTAPGALGDGAGHWTRNLAFSADGQRFFVAIGSRGNLAEDPPPRATIQEFAADGSRQRSFAGGLRNPVGIAFRPGTDELFTVVNERDGMGDGLVPDYLTRVLDGGFYGWPYSWLGQPQPGFADKRPDLVSRTRQPDLLLAAHSAPLGLVFYDGGQFPPEYRGNAFIALHGSWNSGRPTGYMVVRVRFANGHPDTAYQVFATGFRLNSGSPAEVWGRPVGLAVAADGSLLVADDVGQTVWRISYQ
ncbi:MAG TPA: sorbosone dehydrogenase, partial [Rhodospirillaceae bacterium]|nr:sorbosone dehydrogenase [Rhodospirillaceae bacterium]